MVQNDLTHYLSKPNYDKEIMKDIQDISRKIEDWDKMEEIIRNDYIYSLQTSSSPMDKDKVQSSNSTTVADISEKSRELTRRQKRDLEIAFSTRIKELEIFNRIYIIKQSLNADDREIIRLKYEENYTTEAVGLEFDKERSVMHHYIQDILNLMLNLFNSNLSNEQIARMKSSETSLSIKRKKNRLSKPELNGQMTIEQMC